jgi:hypothetical protein
MAPPPRRRQQLLLRALVAAAAGAASCARAQLTYYLSPAGSDASGDGSAARPWATVAHARDAIAPALPGMTGDVTVLLRGGLYPLNDTVTLGPRDSGRNGHSVVYASYPGEAAVLEGGVRVTGWAPWGAGGVWSAPLPAAAVAGGRAPPRDVYIGPDRVNETFLGNDTAYGYTLLSPADTEITPWGYVTNNSDLLAAAAAQEAACASAGGGGGAPWSDPACARDVEFLYRMGGCQWVEDRLRVDAWAPLDGGRLLNVSFPPRGWALQRGKTYANAFPSTVVNTHAALAGDPAAGGWGGRPGTGFVSAAAGRVFYVPRPGDDLAAAEVWVPVVDGPLLRLAGDRAAAPAPAFVASVRLQGLTLRHAGWAHPSGPCGYAPDQSGVYFDCADVDPATGRTPTHATRVVPGALELRTAANVTVEDVVVAAVGGSGITVEDGSQDVVVRSCLLWSTGCHGVRLGQVDDWNTTDPARQNARLTVNDTVVLGAGAVLRDCAAVMGGYVRRSVVAHNTVTEAAWAGVALGWGWGDPPRPTLGGNAVLSNAVTRVNLATADGGPLYMLGGQTEQSEMAGNYVGHALHHAALVYHDEGSCRWYTHDNVVDQAPQDMAVPEGGWWWAFLSAWAPSEHDIVMANTTTRYLNRSDVYAGNNLTVTGTVVLPAGAPWPPAAQAIVDAAGARVDAAALGRGRARPGVVG